MPERPDLEYVVPILRRELVGRTIRALRTKKPVVWRVAVAGTPEALLVELSFADVQRRAHFVLFQFASPAAIELVVSPMLAGRFALADRRTRSPGDLAVGMTLSDGRELRYRDEVQMGKLYLIAAGAWQQVPGLGTVGLDVLDDGVFTREAFRAAARTRRDQIKVFLMDKTALDALGNAYADEVLWEAGVHPKRPVRSLSADDLDRVHDAIVRVLGAARSTIAARQPPLDEKLRDFLRVRGRAGHPCARCGATIRTARVHAGDAHFCPHCQPDTRRSVFVDWRKLEA